MADPYNRLNDATMSEVNVRGIERWNEPSGMVKRRERTAQCQYCEKPSRRACSGGCSYGYCSAQCERKDWRESHKAECKNWSIADYLSKADKN